MSWYETGFDGLEKEEARQESRYGPQRLYLKGGTSRDVVFVDEVPACIYEHNPKINGNYRNWLTCLQGVNDDVVCCQMLGLNTRYYCGYLTVVDCTAYTSEKNGKTYQYGVKLAQGKMKTLKRWKRKAADRGLAGQFYTSTREDDRSPSVGDEWEWRREANMEKLFEVANYKGTLLSEMWDKAEAEEAAMANLMRVFKVQPGEDGKLPRTIPPFNYYEILKPKEPKELKILLNAAQPDEKDGNWSGSQGQAQSRSAANVSEEEVPF